MLECLSLPQTRCAAVGEKPSSHSVFGPKNLVFKQKSSLDGVTCPVLP